MALSKEEEDAFRAWLAARDDDDGDTPDDDDLDDDDGGDTPDDDDDLDDDDDPGVTLKSGGVLIYQGQTYRRVKDKPVKRAPARKRTATTGAPRKRTTPKPPPKDPGPGGATRRKLFNT